MKMVFFHNNNKKTTTIIIIIIMIFRWLLVGSFVCFYGAAASSDSTQVVSSFTVTLNGEPVSCEVDDRAPNPVITDATTLNIPFRSNVYGNKKMKNVLCFFQNDNDTGDNNNKERLTKVIRWMEQPDGSVVEYRVEAISPSSNLFSETSSSTSSSLFYSSSLVDLTEYENDSGGSLNDDAPPILKFRSTPLPTRHGRHLLRGGTTDTNNTNITNNTTTSSFGLSSMLFDDQDMYAEIAVATADDHRRRHRRRLAFPDTCNGNKWVIDVGLVVDSSFCLRAADMSGNTAANSVGDNETKTQDVMTEVLSGTKAYYETICIELVLKRLDIFCDPNNDPLQQVIVNGAAKRDAECGSPPAPVCRDFCNDVLNEFRAYAESTGLSSTVDLVHLIHETFSGTGQEGCAYAPIPEVPRSPICNSDAWNNVLEGTSYNVGIVRQNTNMSFDRVALTLAHELGHNLGGQHITEDSPIDGDAKTAIMWTGSNPNYPGGKKWFQETIGYIHGNLTQATSLPNSCIEFLAISDTATPSQAPTTLDPTSSPTRSTGLQTSSPTVSPTSEPTASSPTTLPTVSPTTTTTAEPTTLSPTISPTTAAALTGSPATILSPTISPTTAAALTGSPTTIQSPTTLPTNGALTGSPTTSPTAAAFTGSPTTSPPTTSPTASPTRSPTASTVSPSTRSSQADQLLTASPTRRRTSDRLKGSKDGRGNKKNGGGNKSEGGGGGGGGKRDKKTSNGNGSSLSGKDIDQQINGLFLGRSSSSNNKKRAKKSN